MRGDFPAYVTLSANGRRVAKHYRNGALHRENGPAIYTSYAAARERGGEVVGEKYYLDGAEYQKDEYDARTKRPTPQARNGSGAHTGPS